MVSARRSPKRKMALTANDAFWHSPINSNGTHSDDDAPSDACKKIHLPPAYLQILTDYDQPSHHESLKGYDHNESIFSFENLDSYNETTTDCDYSSFICQKELFKGKQKGRGSWLLNIARLRKRKTASSLEQQSDEHSNISSPPELVSLPSCSSLEFDESVTDESTVVSTDTDTKNYKSTKGVSFSESVTVQPIPHYSTLSPMEQHKLYTSNFELHLMKIRNKKEFKYDGYDWRNATEEEEMCVDMFSGELVHPAHAHLYD